MRILYLSLILFSSFTSEIFAQSNFDLFQYRYVGPTRGGRVTAVAGIASLPNTYYLGSTGGGVWKTEDYGSSWFNVSDGYFETPSIGAIRVAQNDANILYVGTGTDGFRSNLIQGRGVYKSINAGQSWTHVGLPNVGQIGAVEIHPNDHNTVFVAAIGQAFNSNKERGVYRTQNGGESWKQVLSISDTTGFVDVEFMPTNPNIIYASAWRAERKPWTIISGGNENGIYKSVDGGDNWRRVGNGLPELMGKIDLAVSPDDSKVVYALVEAPAKVSGLYRSNDHGENFEHVSNEYGLSDRPFYYCNVDVDPNDVETVYVNSTRFYKSTNRGKSWKRLRTPHGDNHDMWINPNDSNLFIQGNDGGANITHNGGKTWSSQLNQPTAELYQVEVDYQHPYWLYGGQQDNYSTVSVPSAPPYRHQAGAIGFVMNTGGCETGPAVPNPDNPNIVYSNCKGRFSVYNKTTGQGQEYTVGARNMYGHNPRDLKFRFQRVSPIHVSPHNSNVIYHTSQYVHKTIDEGKTWEIISPDLTAFENDKQVISGSPITNDITGEEFYSTIYAIQESKIKQGLIWVGANDGPIHVTKDNGQNWSNVTPKSLPKGGRVDCVEPSVHSEAKAFVTVLRYQLGDNKPYIYKTENYGKTWQLISQNNGIPNDYPVRVVREDPVVEGLLFAGTEYGMFISFNDGKTWESFQQNLPVTPITDIKIHRDDLVLSTMGRGFQILDNISALRDGFSTLDKKANKLFQPRDAYRYRFYPMNVGSETQPNYPSPGAIFDYYLSEDVDTTLVLHIKDSSGNFIRSYRPRSVSQKEKTNRDMTTEEISYSVSRSLKTTKGFHRFKWDMKRTGIWDKNSGSAYANGPMVLPGEYSIELVVGDQVMQQKFTLMPDPRVVGTVVTMDDLKAQEKLAIQIVDLYSTAKKKANEIDKKLKGMDKNSSDYSNLESEKWKLIQKKGRYTEPKLLSQIRYLYYGMSATDQLPSKDSYDRYEELVKELEAIDY